MTKIISFSLWGHDPKYTVGAIRNSELAKEIYPGWTCRFYLGDEVSPGVSDKLLKNGSEVVVNLGDSGWNGLFWRFFAADDQDCIMISRDTDSRLNPREKAAVDEWLASDKDFHIMRDHPHHRTEILGGMWGCRNGILSNMREMTADYKKGEYDNEYQVDQNFLRDIIYPIVKDKTMVHDEFFEKKPFPTSRLNPQDFVGQSYDENEGPQF